MEKQGFDAARNAARATNPLAAGQAQKGKGASGGGKVYTQLTGPQGKVYLVEDGDLGRLQTLNTTPTTAGFAGLATDKMPDDITTADDAEWEGWMAVIEEEDLRTSVDWEQNSGGVNRLDPTMIAPLSQDQDTILVMTAEKPFYIDSGATVHISPYKSDFIILKPIAPKDIKGVGGSAITA